MSISIRSRKSKGRSLQNWVRDKLRIKWQAVGNEPVNTMYGLVESDVTGKQMGGAGVDVVLTRRAQELIPWDIEAKNQESLNVRKAWEQALANTEPGRKTLLVIKWNGQKPLVVVDAEEIL